MSIFFDTDCMHRERVNNEHMERIARFEDAIDWERTDVEYYEDLVDQVRIADRDRLSDMGIVVFSGTSQRYDDIVKRLRAKTRQMGPAGFADPVIITSAEYANGYQLYDMPEDFIHLALFEDLRSTCWNANRYSKEEFRNRFVDVSYTWYKVNRDGEFFKGFYERPEHKDDAFDLTYDDNLTGMYELSYPHDLVLRSAKIACEYGAECVRWCNAFCEWFRRKNDQMNGIAPKHV
jgi:hypothetical protein